MAPVVFSICFRELLHDVCQQYSLSMPMYGVPVENEKGAIRVYGEVELVRGDTVTEAVRCWSAPCPNIDQSEEDAARRCVGKLRDEFSFDVRDFNLEDKKCFEDLYGRLSIEHDVPNAVTLDQNGSADDSEEDLWRHWLWNFMLLSA
uniref:Uncharacterized protein n=1 Tax=Ananas comosus var. bracteatus TaxID=296719 RepID=A0A6V7QLJ8_ANACO|nr:unnamed protein product [Ananas comosus var. bracteatus]